MGKRASRLKDNSHSDCPWCPMAAAKGLCSPNSKSTLVVILAKAARPRRALALRNWPLFCGVFVTLCWVPSNAVKRQPRQNASGCRRRCARGRSTRCINSAKICQGSRARRSEQALSFRPSSKSMAKWAESVPTGFMA